MDTNRHIDIFLTHLRAERGLSLNTVSSYSRDLIRFVNYLDSNKINFITLTRKEIHEFIIELYDAGLDPRSIARTVSALKSFFSFLVNENIIENNPALNIKAPRHVRKLPEVLTLQRG